MLQTADSKSKVANTNSRMESKSQIVALQRLNDVKKLNLSEFSREQLETRIKQLEAHNIQLKNIIAKKDAEKNVHTSIKNRKSDRPFDFSKHPKRHIALKFAYLGWDYQGFTVQEDTNCTIEAELFNALLKTKLIESRETSNYHRCGRTDKGVSAFSQVISLTLRCCLKSGLGVIEDGSDVDQPEEQENVDLGNELNYVQMLNRVLPSTIRVLAWAPVAEGFSSRFDCTSRTYKYFFPRGNLDIPAMETAASYLIGSHDFRNFCKMDVGHGIVNFRRTVDEITFSTPDLKTKLDSDSKLLKETDMVDPYDICFATVKSQAFLWHQIRAIMMILFLVGDRREQPSVVQELLNVEKFPRKPQYGLANEIPLVLYATEFPDLEWHCSNDLLQENIIQLQSQWMPHAIKSSMITHLLNDLTKQFSDVSSKHNKENGTASSLIYEGLSCTGRMKNYQPLLSRKTCDSLEEKIAHFVKRRKLDPQVIETISPQT